VELEHHWKPRFSRPVAGQAPVLGFSASRFGVEPESAYPPASCFDSASVSKVRLSDSALPAPLGGQFLSIQASVSSGVRIRRKILAVTAPWSAECPGGGVGRETSVLPAAFRFFASKYAGSAHPTPPEPVFQRLGQMRDALGYFRGLVIPWGGQRASNPSTPGSRFTTFQGLGQTFRRGVADKYRWGLPRLPVWRQDTVELREVFADNSAIHRRPRSRASGGQHTRAFRRFVTITRRGTVWARLLGQNLRHIEQGR